MLMRPEIENRKTTIPRSPPVSSARLRRCTAVRSLELAMSDLTQLELPNFERARGSQRGCLAMQLNLERDVHPVCKGMMTFDLDPEIGAQVAVDIALDHGEVPISTGFKRYSQLTCRRKFRSRDKCERIISCITEVGVDCAEVNTVPGREPENGITVSSGRCRELEGIVTVAAVHDVNGVARDNGVVARAGINVLDAPKRVVPGLRAAGAPVRIRSGTEINKGIDSRRR